MISSGSKKQWPFPSQWVKWRRVVTGQECLFTLSIQQKTTLIWFYFTLKLHWASLAYYVHLSAFHLSNVGEAFRIIQVGIWWYDFLGAKPAAVTLLGLGGDSVVNPMQLVKVPFSQATQTGCTTIVIQPIWPWEEIQDEVKVCPCKLYQTEQKLTR